MSILKTTWNSVSNLCEGNSRNNKPRKKFLQAPKTQVCFQLCPIFFANTSDKKNNAITIIKQFQNVKFVGIAVILDLFSSDFRLTEHSGELH